ncbi:MAG: hypothetical protein WD768_21875 [Phycisphaeraceae bacterium]
MKTLLFGGFAALAMMFAAPGQAQAQHYGHRDSGHGQVRVNVGYHNGHSNVNVGYNSGYRGHQSHGHYSHGHTSRYQPYCPPPVVYRRPVYHQPTYCPPPVVYHRPAPVYYTRPSYGCQGW